MTKTNEIAKKKKKVPVLPYFLMLPAFVLFATFSFYPFMKTFIDSFSVTDEIGRWLGWAGLDNWKNMANDPHFWKIIGNTFIFAGMNLVLTFVSAMILAILGCKRGKGQKIVTTLYALPLAISHTAASAVWIMMFDLPEKGGFINSVLGTRWYWLLEPKTAMLCVAIVTSWSHVAGSYLYLLAGFRNVSDELLEAATLDGANGFVKATKIMVPIASPQIFFVLFLSLVTAFKTFTQIKLLTGGGPNYATTTITTEIYSKAMNTGMFEIACCYSVILFVIIFLVTRIQFFFEKKFVFYQ